MIEIDATQRVTLVPLKGDGRPLKNKIPYDQLQPCLISELHKFHQTSLDGAGNSGCDSNLCGDVVDVGSSSDCVPDVAGDCRDDCVDGSANNDVHEYTVMDNGGGNMNASGSECNVDAGSQYIVHDGSDNGNVAYNGNIVDGGTIVCADGSDVSIVGCAVEDGIGDCSYVNEGTSECNVVLDVGGNDGNVVQDGNDGCVVDVGGNDGNIVQDGNNGCVLDGGGRGCHCVNGDGGNCSVATHDMSGLSIGNKKWQSKSNFLYATPNKDTDKLAMEILRKGSWLTDEHVDHAQWLMKRQYPDINGFHSVLAFQRNSKVKRGLPNFVQVLNVDDNHWITISNIGCDDNHIKVYDSLYRGIPKSGRSTFLAAVALLLNTSKSDMTIEWVDTVKQSGGSDCGLFAIATAVCLCNGRDPRKEVFDQSVMREHLALCIHCDEISPFPLTSSSRRPRSSIKRHVDLHCHCRLPHEEGVFMVECCHCKEWYHRLCENVPKKVTAKTVFKCKKCKIL